MLIERWIALLRAALTYVRQFPIERMGERAVESRDRSIRLLCHHVFRIAEAFLECVRNGVEYGIGFDDLPPQAGTCSTGDEIAEYGAGVIERLKDWGRTSRRTPAAASAKSMVPSRFTSFWSARPGTPPSTRGN